MVFITAGLTLTWDVLKYELPDYIYVSNDRLTLTWDVLKCKQTYDSFTMPFRLTLTGDVLKCILTNIHFPSRITININMRCIEIAAK